MIPWRTVTLTTLERLPDIPMIVRGGRGREARLGGDQNGDPKSKQVAEENPVILMRDNFYGVDFLTAQEVIVQGENL